MARPHSISVGTVFDRLTYLGQEKYFSGNKKGLFKCACGTEKYMQTSPVFNGKVKSCGCKKTEFIVKYKTSHCRSRDGGGSAYSTWSQLSQRCYNPNHPAYPDYGGRGIKVCDRWLNSFENFLEDMGERPDSMTLDRYPDVNGDYEPGNCRWASREEQANNTRKTRRFDFHGQSRTIKEIAEMCGIDRVRLTKRLETGIPVERAVVDGGIQGSLLEYNGMSMNISAWARHLGLKVGTLSSRLRRGLSISESLRPGNRRYPQK